MRKYLLKEINLAEAVVKKIVVEMLTKRGDAVDISNARLVSGMVLPDLDGTPQGALLKLIFAEEEKLIVG